MNDIAFKVIIKNDGIDDVIFKTLMLKGEKGDKGDAGGADIDDSTTSSTKTWSSNKIRNEIDAKPDNLSELDDVDLDSISDEQLLGYNFTTGKWENKSVDASTLKYDANSSIKNKIDEKANTADLATVATSGDYDDLSNKPSIPPAQVNADWNASSGVAEILNKPQLATVATSGDYDDLSNKPSIPVVDQTLNPSSSNAISNSAVVNGLSDKQDKLTTISGSITANTSGGWAVYGQLKKYGNVVSFYIDGNKSSALDSGWNTIGTLQSGFRPTHNFDFAMIDPGSDFASEGKVNTDGTIQVYKNANSTTRIRAQATFII